MSAAPGSTPIALVDTVGAALSLEYLRDPHGFAASYFVAVVGQLSRDEREQLESAITDILVGRAIGCAAMTRAGVETAKSIFLAKRVRLTLDDHSDFPTLGAQQ